jgi:hypothetical protein
MGLLQRTFAWLVVAGLVAACQTDPQVLGGDGLGAQDGLGDAATPADLGGQDGAPAEDATAQDGKPLADTLDDTTAPDDGASLGDLANPDGGDPGPYEGLYQDRVVLRFDLELDTDDWEGVLGSILDCEGDMCGSKRLYVPGTMIFHNPWTGQDERVEQVALRYRGNSSACMPEDNPRIGYKVSLNEYEPGRRFHGQKKLNFLGTEGDSSLLREVLAFESMKRFGLPAAKVGFAWVRVNGGPGHLHPFIQESDDTPYIEEILGETTKGAYFKVDGYCGRPEFTEWEEGIQPASLTKVWEPKAGTLPEAMNTTLIPLLECFSFDSDSQFQDCFEARADADLWLRALAQDTAMPDPDGFGFSAKNHSLYFRHSDNRAVVVMWDKDGSYKPEFCYNEDIFECIPSWISTHSDGLMRLRDVYQQDLDTLMLTFATTVMGDLFLPQRLEHWYTLLTPFAALDDDMVDHALGWDWDESVQSLRDKILARRAALTDALSN